MLQSQKDLTKDILIETEKAKKNMESNVKSKYLDHFPEGLR